MLDICIFSFIMREHPITILEKLQAITYAEMLTVPLVKKPLKTWSISG